MLEFNIRNQCLSRIDSFRPAEKSVGYLKAKFNLLTDEWKSGSLKARARNRADQIVYEADIVDGICVIPWEALDKSGMFAISVFCQDGDTEITTNAVDIGLSATLPGGSESNPPTPTELDEIRQEIAQLKEQAGSAVTAPSDLSVNDPEAAGYVKNRTHWVERKFEPFGFENGVIPDEYQIDLSALELGIAYRISDQILTKEQLDGARCRVYPMYGDDNDGPITHVGTSEKDAELFSYYILHPAIQEDLSYGYLLFVKEAGTDSVTVDGYVVSIEVPAAGVYLTLSGANLLKFTVYNETYKKIDKNYIPVYTHPLINLTEIAVVPIGGTMIFSLSDNASLQIQHGFVRVGFNAGSDVSTVEVAASFARHVHAYSSRNHVLIDDKWRVVSMIMEHNQLTVTITEE